MYASDYMYAASPNGWNLLGYYYNSNAANNWLFGGFSEWTISRNYEYSFNSFCVNDSGGVNGIFVTFSSLAFRPTIYLEPNVEFSSGSGTESDPYRIS